MSRFVEGEDRRQPALLPSCRDDYVDGQSPVRVIDVFVDELDLAGLGFERVQPASTGRPGYHPAAMLKLYLYGYLNQVQSSRRLEREAGRNTELMWLLGKLTPDFKTIADFRRDNGEPLRAACAARMTAWMGDPQPCACCAGRILSHWLLKAPARDTAELACDACGKVLYRAA
jgi:transposase